MPTYDYQCDNCGHTFEAFQSMKDDPLTVCPECNQPRLRRLISGGVGIIFKGSGFYVNDNKKSSSSSQKKSASSTTGSGSAKSEKGSSESKSATGSAKGKKSA